MAKKNNNTKDNTPVEGAIDDTPQDVVEENKSNLYKLKIRKSEPKYTSADIPQSKQTCMLVSRLNSPIYIAYGNTSLLIPPRGKVSDLNPEMLGSLPKGIDSVIR